MKINLSTLYICCFFLIIIYYKLYSIYKYKFHLSFHNITVIACVFGTRQEIIKLAPVIKELEIYMYQFKIVTIFTGEHEDISKEYLSLFNITPTYKLRVEKKKYPLGIFASKLLKEINNILLTIYPSLLIIQGGSTSAMSGALSAFYLNIPTAHIEAGIRTYQIDYPFPEEMNRQLISKISTYHFAATLFNIQNLNQECLSSSHIYLVGNTIFDSLLYVLSKNNAYKHTLTIYKNIILFTTHRRENEIYFNHA